MENAGEQEYSENEKDPQGGRTHYYLENAGEQEYSKSEEDPQGGRTYYYLGDEDIIEGTDEIKVYISGGRFWRRVSEHFSHFRGKLLKNTSVLSGQVRRLQISEEQPKEDRINPSSNTAATSEHVLDGPQIPRYLGYLNEALDSLEKKHTLLEEKLRFVSKESVKPEGLITGRVFPSDEEMQEGGTSPLTERLGEILTRVEGLERANDVLLDNLTF